MSDDEEQEQGLPENAEEVDKIREQLFGELLDTNHDIVTYSREAARRALALRELYLDQVNRCEELAAVHIRGAQITSGTIADILSIEYDLEEVEDDGEEEDDG